jgi:hypothetical protein
MADATTNSEKINPLAQSISNFTSSITNSLSSTRNSINNFLENATEGISIASLEIQTGLSFGSNGVLYKIKHSCMPSENLYAALLFILVKGYAALGAKFTYIGSDPVSVTPDLYKWFVNCYIKDNGLEDSLKNTPAGRSKELQDIGADGSFSRYAAHNTMNVMTGPGVNAPCLVSDLLNKIHPGMTDDIENFCNVIRTRSYLSLPSDSFGGLTQAMWFITGAVTALYQGLVEIYQGMVLLIQQVYAWINNIYRMIQQFIMSVIEQIVPLDLICLILDAVQTILDDVGFFAQLFNGSDNLFQTLNAIQTVVNYASFGVNFAYDPLGGLASLFPKETQKVYDFIKNIENLPQTYLGKLVQHVGFGTAVNNEALAIANTIVQRYKLGSSLGPLGDVLASAGTVGNRSKWYRTSATGVNIGNIGSPNPYTYSIANISGNLPPLNINLQPFGWVGTTIDSFKSKI